MGLKEDRDYLNSLRAERRAIRENAIKQEKKDYNNRIIDREDIRAKHEAALDRFYSYKDNVKKALLKKALIEIYTGSFNSISRREYNACENLLEQYIGEVGTTKLLKNMGKSDSSILRTIKEKTDEYSASITADATADDPASQTIKKEDINSFWKEIDRQEDISDITNLIRLRVSNAEEDFINKNLQDKENINDILKKTASRIQMAKGNMDNDYSETVEESETRIAKDMIYKIQHEGHRNVFGKMVHNLSSAAMKNQSAKEVFTNESGRLDVDHIVEAVRCMYTLLEMVGTIQLEKVDNEYIESTLRSIG